MLTTPVEVCMLEAPQAAEVLGFLPLVDHAVGFGPRGVFAVLLVILGQLDVIAQTQVGHEQLLKLLPLHLDSPKLSSLKFLESAAPALTKVYFLESQFDSPDIYFFLCRLYPSFSTAVRVVQDAFPERAGSLPRSNLPREVGTTEDGEV